MAALKLRFFFAAALIALTMAACVVQKATADDTATHAAAPGDPTGITGAAAAAANSPLGAAVGANSPTASGASFSGPVSVIAFVSAVAAVVLVH